MQTKHIKRTPWQTITCQGGLLKVERHRPQVATAPNTGGGKRGAITHFSRASRKRLLELFARLRDGEKLVFVTLTYGQKWPTPAEAKAHYRALMERIRRRYPHVSAVWRIEYQSRGAPHFHIICYGLPYVPKRQLARVWHEIIGDEYADQSGDDVQPPFTRIEMIRSRRKAMSYVSKYVAKADDAAEPAAPPEASGSGFNDDAYSHAGRYWGVHNRPGLPFADVLVMHVLETGGARKVLMDLRRYAKRVWAGIRVGRVQGWTLFGDAQQWYELLHWSLMQQDDVRLSPSAYMWSNPLTS